MKHETRLSLDIDRDWEWTEWPDTEHPEGGWEEEGMEVRDQPNQAVFD